MTSTNNTHPRSIANPLRDPFLVAFLVTAVLVVAASVYPVAKGIPDPAWLTYIIVIFLATSVAAAIMMSVSKSYRTLQLALLLITVINTIYTFGMITHTLQQ